MDGNGLASGGVIGAPPADGATPLPEARGIAKSFLHVRALDRVGFAVYPGEVVALVGDSGAAGAVSALAPLGHTGSPYRLLGAMIARPTSTASTRPSTSPSDPRSFGRSGSGLDVIGIPRYRSGRAVLPVMPYAQSVSGSRCRDGRDRTDEDSP